MIFLFLLLAGALLFLERETLLVRLATFMAPRSDTAGDVAILEGAQFIDRGVVECGMDLFLSGSVQRIVVVLHQTEPSQRPFGLDEDYADRVREDLEALGLQEGDFTVLVTPIHNPITLTAAKNAMEVLSREGVRSAVVVSQGFRTRRVCLAYQQAGRQWHMGVHPHACFTSYQGDRWWSQGPAVRDFVLELQKLVYYYLRGYVSLRLSGSAEPSGTARDRSAPAGRAAP